MLPRAVLQVMVEEQPRPGAMGAPAPGLADLASVCLLGAHASSSPILPGAGAGHPGSCMQLSVASLMVQDLQVSEARGANVHVAHHYT